MYIRNNAGLWKKLRNHTVLFSDDDDNDDEGKISFFFPFFFLLFFPSFFGYRGAIRTAQPLESLYGMTTDYRRGEMNS